MKNDLSYLEFKKQLVFLKEQGIKPTLLLHSCCGPCSSHVLTLLHDYFQITIYYDNSNIYPENEFVKRLNTQQEIIDKLGFTDVKIIPGNYDHQEYLRSIDGLENLGEGSLRCYKCYEMRIAHASDIASSLGFDYFTTTLSISPYKNAEWINELGYKYQKKSKYLYSNFKKEDGYKKSIALSRLYDLYRQDYCGCEMSIIEHQQRLKNE